MAGINLTSPSAMNTAVLIADSLLTTGGSSDSIATMTKVAGVPVKAALEIQSTTGGVLLPRMTNTQITALTPLVAGMVAFNSTAGTVTSYSGAEWIQFGAFASGSLTAAQINGMFAAPVTLLAATTANNIIVIKRIAIQASGISASNGGNVYLQYGVAAGSTATQATAPAAIPATFIQSAGTNTIIAQGLFGGATGTSIATASVANQPISITNLTAAFTASAAGLNWKIWYDVLVSTGGA